MQYIEKFYFWLIQAGMPVVFFYVSLCGNIFLNTAAEDAQGLEKWGNYILAPTQYLLAGKVADKESYTLTQRFEYEEGFGWKTAGAVIGLPVSLIVGSALKGSSYLFPETRARHQRIAAQVGSTTTQSNRPLYESKGIPLDLLEEEEPPPPPQYVRRPGDGQVLRAEKEALKEVVKIFEAHDILFWVDCGTLLGAYRYGGAIPWDNDIDIAILAPDFCNAKQALNALDPEKYVVVDWSGRTRPETFLVVCIKETGSRIDIGHFSIDDQKRELTLVLSNEESIFLPEIWKVTERRFVIPTPYEVIFPLKKVYFDGIEVPVPHKTEEYLQARYGQDLRPSKVYDPITQQYEKDLTHPYWQRF